MATYPSLKRLVTVVLPLSLLSACASSPDTGDELAAIYQDPAYLHLSQSASSIQESAARLADIEGERYVRDYGAQAEAPDASLLPGLDKHISLGAEWHGPVDKLVSRVAAQVGYTTQVIGVKPSGGVIVSVDTDYRTALSILRDAGTQAGSNARLTIRAKSRTIEIEYLSV